MAKKFKYTELSSDAQEKAQKDYLNQFLKSFTTANFKLAHEVLSTDKEYFDENGNYIEKIK